MAVRYEKLVEAPVKTLVSIAEFCGLSADERMLEYAADVMRPGNRYPQIVFDPAISDVFDKTMEKLGYVGSE